MPEIADHEPPIIDRSLPARAKPGEGGMGVVYRTTDTKLNREVAMKILPDMFASDSDRLARFAREAMVLTSINHPNIAGIYGVEDRAGSGADRRPDSLGPSLSSRLSR